MSATTKTFDELHATLENINQQITSLSEQANIIKQEIASHPNTFAHYADIVIECLSHYGIDDLEKKCCSILENLQSIPTIEERDELEEIDSDDEGVFDESKIPRTTIYTMRYLWAGEEVHFKLIRDPRRGSHMLCESEDDYWCLEVRKICRSLLEGKIPREPLSDKHLPIFYAYQQLLLQ